MQNLNPEFKRIIQTLRNRVEHNVKGRSLFESKEEIAVVFYLKEKLGFGFTDIGKMLGVHKVVVYRWFKGISQGHATIWTGNKNEKVSVSVEELESLAEELLKASQKKWLKSVTQSKTIQQFISKPLKRQKTSKHGRYYTTKQVQKVVKTFNDIAKTIEEKQEYFKKEGYEPSNNPDYWSEDLVRLAIETHCKQKYSEKEKQIRCIREMKLNVRVIKQDWFKGEIGSVRSVSKPIPNSLFYADYIKIKQTAKNPEDKALWLIIGLHIWAGTREGWGSIENEIDRLRKQGISVNVKPHSLDLDHELVNTSLIGLKWDKAILSNEGKLIGFEIWENKTQKTWMLKYQWLDKDITKELEKVYKFAKQRGIKSVVKSILLYYNVKPESKTTGWTISQFKTWYSKKLKEIGKRIGLSWNLTPHRLRSAHISIGAELGIPLELFLQNTGFGVGWEDITTATHFYLRYSQKLIEKYLLEAEKRKSELIS